MLLLYINLGDRNPPYPALACNIPSARSPGQRFHLASMQGSSLSLRFVNRHGGTLRSAGWVAFTKWLISHLPPTFATIIHIPCPLRPCIWLPRVPVPHVPASHTWCPQVPRLASPSPKSPHTRPDVPIPLSPSHFYTQPKHLVKFDFFFRDLSEALLRRQTPLHQQKGVQISVPLKMKMSPKILAKGTNCPPVIKS